MGNNLKKLIRILGMGCLVGLLTSLVPIFIVVVLEAPLPEWGEILIAIGFISGVIAQINDEIEHG